MGLYLCAMDDGEDMEGVDVGSYSDFGFFREAVSNLLEGKKVGSKYPVLTLHSDCDGEWSPEDCVKLEAELQDISSKFNALPPMEYNSVWQKQVAREFGLSPGNLKESFIDVDGEPLIDRLLELTHLAIKKKLPIVFQ